MERLLIADDEEAIREGLKRIIDWENEGFSLCGEACNGEEALKKITELKPDLVMLDVKMPKMQGTEVIQRARALGFKGKCIILSGYSDFAYAQSAIKSGVNFYLLKPIDEDELLSAVQSIKRLNLAEQEKNKRYNALKSRAKNLILQDIIKGKPAPEITPSDLEALKITADTYQVVICEDFKTEAKTAPYTFAELLRVTNKDDSTFNHAKIDNHDVVLLKGDFGLNKLNDFLMHFEDYSPQENSPLGSLFLTIGSPVSSIEDIPKSYSEASLLLRRRFFCAPELHYLDYKLLPKICNCSDEACFPLEEKSDYYGNLFTDYITSFNRNMIAVTLSELEKELIDFQEDINSIRMLLIDIYLFVKEKISACYPTVDIGFEANSTVIEFISNQSYLSDIIRYLSAQFDMMMSASGNPSRDTVLDDVIFYIDHNYKNNIKLETLAPLFGYSSAYLGKIFCKTVGQSFNMYLDSKRIELSKEMLQDSNIKVYEIAEAVGYRNVDYFHKKFKKYVGESPAEYRKKTESP